MQEESTQIPGPLDSQLPESQAPPAEPQVALKKAEAVPPSTTHHAACGVVGETGDHGDLGSNAIDYVGPLRPETVKG
jgi:hypothetical protein